MAAHGSGAAARSIRDRVTVMNVDVGGGTSKIAICADGRVIDVTALDVGARLVCLDAGRHASFASRKPAAVSPPTSASRSSSAPSFQPRRRARWRRGWRTACSRP